MKRSECEARLTEWLDGADVITGATILTFLDSIMLKKDAPKFDPEEPGPYTKKLIKLQKLLLDLGIESQDVHLSPKSVQNLRKELGISATPQMVVFSLNLRYLG